MSKKTAEHNDPESYYHPPIEANPTTTGTEDNPNPTDTPVEPGQNGLTKSSNGTIAPRLGPPIPATQSLATIGRIATFGTLAGIKVQIGGGGAAYATASGGLPIDLAGLLTAAAPFDQPFVHPGDVVGFLPVGNSTNGYTPGALLVGTPTYAPATYPFAGGPAAASRPALQLATCPTTIRLTKGGVEVADGANSDTFTGILLLARGGSNTN